MLLWRGHCVTVERTLCYCGENIVLLWRGHGVTVERTLCYCGEAIVLLWGEIVLLWRG